LRLLIAKPSSSRIVGAPITRSADDRQLLPVLFAEYREIRRDLIEQLGHHGRHAGEMAGADRPAQGFAKPADRNAGREALRIHFLDHGGPEQRDVRRFEQQRILRGLPRIGGEILVRPELGGVDEDRDDHVGGQLLGAPDQRQVPFVQRAHGGHQRDSAARPQIRDGGAQFSK